jgi:hypothetical protein
MKIKTIFTLLSAIICFSSYAQNDADLRNAFTLKLPVDGKQFYEQEIQQSPYFVKEKVLQIYTGEKLFIEVETLGNKITAMKVVKNNVNPTKTIEIELKQEVKEKASESLMLKIKNPFKKTIKYKAMMFIVGQDKWIPTNVLPIEPELSSFELWKDIIITMVLTDWTLK